MGNQSIRYNHKKGNEKLLNEMKDKSNCRTRLQKQQHSSKDT